MGADLMDVSGLVPLGFQRGDEVVKVFGQRPGLVRSQGQRLGIKQSRPDLGGLGFRVSGQILGCPFVGASLFSLTCPISVHESVIPDLATLLKGCHA
jgi:hypothetical protein